MGKPKPGCGALPITVTCGSSCAAAGLPGFASASASAADAPTGNADPAKHRKAYIVKKFVDRANHFSAAHYRPPVMRNACSIKRLLPGSHPCTSRTNRENLPVALQESPSAVRVDGSWGEGYPIPFHKS